MHTSAYHKFSYNIWMPATLRENLTPIPAKSAAAHSLNNSVASIQGVFFCDRIISSEFWPSHSPNLYPSNSQMWEMLKNKLYRKILRCAIPVVCLNYMVRLNSVKNTNINIWLNDGVYWQWKNYMFRPIAAIIRFWQLSCYKSCI